MRYGSVCSGIEAASAAWTPLGWEPQFFSEIRPFARAVLAHHWPGVPCHGDFTSIGPDDYGSIDVLVGGTPCQSFSVAGFRRGMADDRGNLALEYLGLVDRLRPRWVVWENVPGVLTTHKGRDFGSIIGALGELGYGFSWRVLDARFFGLAQRRRRLFLVGYFGDWRRAAAVLVERTCLQWGPEPRGPASAAGAGGPESDAAAAGGAATVAAFGGHNSAGEITTATGLNGHGGSHGRLDFATETFVAFTFHGRDDGVQLETEPSDVAPTLRTPGGGSSHTFVRFFDAVRRLTPLECERLQGFPDGYTDVPYHPGRRSMDGLRYEALGDSMAVPVMRWLGRRIAAVDALP